MLRRKPWANRKGEDKTGLGRETWREFWGTLRRKLPNVDTKPLFQGPK